MTESQYDKLCHKICPSNSLITIDDLKNKKDRTLLYGYTCDRSTWHVFVKDGKITVVVYKYDDKEEDIKGFAVYSNSQYIPDKRLYAECCDFEFCSLLVDRGVNLPFTSPSFNKKQKRKQYYGVTI